MGGENQKGRLNHDTGYSEKAQRTGKPSYLEPNSGCMQKPIEGAIANGAFRCQKHVEKTSVRIYLERIRNRMHEPIEGLLAQRLTRQT
jgi:hypothetical protein